MSIDIVKLADKTAVFRKKADKIIKDISEIYRQEVSGFEIQLSSEIWDSTQVKGYKEGNTINYYLRLTIKDNILPVKMLAYLLKHNCGDAINIYGFSVNMLLGDR